MQFCNLVQIVVACNDFTFGVFRQQNEFKIDGLTSKAQGDLDRRYEVNFFRQIASGLGYPVLYVPVFASSYHCCLQWLEVLLTRTVA